jgi:4-hydroxythreonine-4-phosphate dehydrogenase
MVTAPMSKEGFYKAGVDFPGHTEMLAELCGVKRYAMMLFGGPLRITLVTRHVPLTSVSKSLTTAGILETIRITGKALPWLGSPKQRIAVCGLNPHAGDGGTIGREEITVIEPAIRKAREESFDVSGPVPADIVFHQALQGKYDAIVSMYHDQGLGPLKMLAFNSGVNITLGLPIVRTSPDHGTAFDIAGKGIANPASMIEAIRWAARLARRKNPWRKEK